MSSRPALRRSGVGEGDAGVQSHHAHQGGIGVGTDRAVTRERAGDPGLLEGVREVARRRGAGEGAGGCEQLLLCAGGDDLAVADDDEVIGDDLDLVQEVRGQQHGSALVGVAPQQVAHPADPGRVETVGRLVEDQHSRVAQQRGGDAEALAHAE